MSWLKDKFFKVCRFCKAEGQVVYREVDDVHEDTQHWCKACGKKWYCEGPDY